MSRIGVFTYAMAVALVSGASVAHAQPLPPSSTWTGTGVDSRIISSQVPGYCNQQDAGNAFTLSGAPQSVSSSVSSICYAGTASAMVTGRAGDGLAGLNVVAAAAGAECGPNCYEGASAYGSGESGLLDYFVVQSNILAPATPVTIYFRTALDASYSQQSNNAYLRRSAQLVASTTGGAAYLNFAPGDPSQSVAFSFLAYVGVQFSASLDLRGDLGVDVNPQQSGSADIDATGRMWLDVGSPDARLVSSSGYDYSSAIATPEPGSLILLLTGLSGIGVVARRRARS